MNRDRKILAFETSCDDTAVAIINGHGQILAEAVFSQIKEHAQYLGVVPEVGSRAHIEQIIHVTRQVFNQAGLEQKHMDYVAATVAPGLIGPLLVGSQFAKGFAQAHSIPFIGVHHIEGHILSGFSEPDFPKPPFLALIVSGGHTALYVCEDNYRIRLLSSTLDDAAGEAFDKIGRAVGLGYPAGKDIDVLAQKGDKARFSFPIALRHDPQYNFSFSGLKTKALQLIEQHAPFNEQTLADFCASLNEAIALALCEKATKAVKDLNLPALVIGGGVAANSRVRAMLLEKSLEQKFSLFLPEKKYCTDNASMIARAALVKIDQGFVSPYTVDVSAHLPVEQVVELYQFQQNHEALAGNCF